LGGWGVEGCWGRPGGFCGALRGVCGELGLVGVLAAVCRVAGGCGPRQVLARRSPVRRAQPGCRPRGWGSELALAGFDLVEGGGVLANCWLASRLERFVCLAGADFLVPVCLPATAGRG
jgi:hypothetical protein